MSKTHGFEVLMLQPFKFQGDTLNRTSRELRSQQVTIATDALTPVYYYNSNKPLAYIDTQAKIISQTPYRNRAYFSESLAAVGLEKGCGYTDKKGQLLFSNESYDRCGDFSEGVAVALASLSGQDCLACKWHEAGSCD